jgi:hypothetical protein
VEKQTALLRFLCKNDHAKAPQVTYIPYLVEDINILERPTDYVFQRNELPINFK